MSTINRPTPAFFDALFQVRGELQYPTEFPERLTLTHPALAPSLFLSNRELSGVNPLNEGVIREELNLVGPVGAPARIDGFTVPDGFFDVVWVFTGALSIAAPPARMLFIIEFSGLRNVIHQQLLPAGGDFYPIPRPTILPPGFRPSVEIQGGLAGGEVLQMTDIRFRHRLGMEPLGI